MFCRSADSTMHFFISNSVAPFPSPSVTHHLFPFLVSILIAGLSYWYLNFRAKTKRQHLKGRSTFSFFSLRLSKSSLGPYKTLASPSNSLGWVQASPLDKSTDRPQNSPKSSQSNYETGAAIAAAGAPIPASIQSTAASDGSRTNKHHF